MEVLLGCNIVPNFCRLYDCLITVLIGFRSCSSGLPNLRILSPVIRKTPHLRYPILVITLKFFNLISRMTNPAFKFYLTRCFLLNLCCSSQLNLDKRLSFLLSTQDILESINSRNLKFSGILLSMLQLPTLS